MAILESTNAIESELLELLPAESVIETLFDRLWPICRSITGRGFRDSLKILGELMPQSLHSFRSGERVLDWKIPKEWNIHEAWIKDSDGNDIVNFRNSNLHVVGYSSPINKILSLDELLPHLHSLPQQPNAIPYLTSYYREDWGFCISEEEKRKLLPGMYHIHIDSELFEGELQVAEAVLPSTGKSMGEILLSTYLCHPSMANNELSGPIVTTLLYETLKKVPNRRFTYRFVILPETIGSIAYLSRFGEHLKATCRAGYVITCCGDPNQVTFKEARSDHWINNLTTAVLKKSTDQLKVYPFFPTGSDERQYCSPGFDLPVASIMRTMYGEYPEYHTSLDDKSFISMTSMKETLYLYLKVLMSIEENQIYVSTQMKGEPNLGARGLYPQLGGAKDTRKKVERMMWLLNYSDGAHDLHSIAELSGYSILDLAAELPPLINSGLLGQKR